MRSVLLLLLGLVPASVRAAEPYVPILVPITGFLAVEGRSQRNGALLAFQDVPPGLRVRQDVLDTGVSPEVAVNALQRAAGDGNMVAAVAPMLGTQMLALLPVAEELRVPLLTVSGTDTLTRQGNPFVFRFFPGDRVTKTAQVRYALEQRGFRRPAVLYQTTAYGQSGFAEIKRLLDGAGVPIAYADGLDVSVRDMLPALARVQASGADSLLLHLHSGPTALLLRAAKAMGLALPIVAGSGLSQPSTTALLDVNELAGVCAETGSSPISADDPGSRAFVDAYRRAFNTDPDAFALGQYDGTRMLLGAMAGGATTAEQITRALGTTEYQGLAMTYRSNGHGDMAHSAMIVCFDRGTRVPSIVARFSVP